MYIDNFKTSKQGANHLSTIKRRTGFSEYHPICRYALCFSLGDSTPPRNQDFDSKGVFLEWSTFGQEYSEILLALLLARCKRDGIEFTSQSIRKEFIKHLHRGLGALAANMNLKDEGIIGIPVNTSSTSNDEN